MQRIEAVGHLRVLAVGREQELHQVVGADRQEVRLGGELVELEEQRGHLDHHPELDAEAAAMAVAVEMRALALDDAPWRAANSSTVGDHRQHDLDSRPAAALSRARICARSRPGRSSPMRIARQPSAGFSSSTCRI